jgi:hypothetical protein
MATRNIVPRATGEGNIGTNLKHWLKGWFDSIFCAGDITDGSDSITVAELARLPDPESGDDGKVLTYDYGTDAYVLETNVAVDERVKASADDPSAGYLDAKIDGINLDIISEKIAVKVGSDLEEAITLRHASGSDNQDALEVETEDSGINVQEALNTLESDQHTHSNKTILDQIQEALLEIQGAEGLDAVLCLDADDGDNNEDTWFIKSLASDNSLSIINHTTERLKLTYDGILNTQDIYPLIDNTYFLGRNDLGSPKAWKGVVVKDTTNGNYYAIQVTNGSVVATLMESGGI